ncbi:MAG: hypothetical protein E7539_06920 [Ruminococcaceae bacterium]|nr:hypothetical protein [Oscillospiraceae bacterium]
MLIFNKEKAISICLKNTNKYVALAAEDLKKDFARVNSAEILPEITSYEQDECIIIEENTEKDSDGVSDESFSIKGDCGKIRISANTYMGTMWGIYTFCEKVLGVDPCYLFNDLELEKKEELYIDGIDIEEKCEGYTFRGVFINDEDFLTGLKAGGIRYIHYRWYTVCVAEDVMHAVVETLLRLKLNLVIPATLLDIDNPNEKLLADCVAERGIYLSQHHLEPLGLSHFTMDNYLRKYNKEGKFSYINYPELMVDAWTFYAQKWAEYDNVVWQIGLRGKADRPLWEEDIPTEEELRGYAKFISDAYQTQVDIVKKATGGRAKYFTSTLWMEGSRLAEKGLLKFPEGTAAIFADTGPSQMFSDDFYNIKRNKQDKYGIYYHLQYYCCGPHLAPQTGLDKLYYNLNLAYECGDSFYSIVNLSNVREFTFELKAYSDILWNVKGFDKQKYLDDYCALYGEKNAEIKKLITDYYGKLPEIDVKHLSKHHEKYFNYSFRKAPDGIKNFVVKEGNVLEHGEQIISCFHEPLPDRLYKEFYDELKLTICDYEKLYADFKKLHASLSGRMKKHLEVKWLLYTDTLLSIYKWYINLYEAKIHCDNMQSEKMYDSLNSAIESLLGYIRRRKCAEYGWFENWFSGDVKLDVKLRLFKTCVLLGRTPEFK